MKKFCAVTLLIAVLVSLSFTFVQALEIVPQASTFIKTATVTAKVNSSGEVVANAKAEAKRVADTITISNFKIVRRLKGSTNA